ncbi:hypothetical protein CGZ90_15860 [Fictibacillus aquaticus]|uniref:Alkyl hydroperoxide reductase subunit C/ Thiol specific antioxidant domain-containing protein n=3 Tax=Fictibacillus aquaticus TaxID=2021314 RepID=A0A235F5A3_9BACL|nr:hypothetical protein CGZ90_15860 [Fictibacillus aquaticus]
MCFIFKFRCLHLKNEGTINRIIKGGGMMLKAGDQAPEFSLPSTSGKDISLSDFKGEKNVLVAFYPLNFTPG